MIARPTTSRPLVEKALEAIDKEPERRVRFWSRINSGHVVPLELLSDEESVGVAFVSAAEYDQGRKLTVELSMEPGKIWGEGDELWSILEKVARSSGCDSVVFESSRPGWERMAPRFGFESLGTVTRYERMVS